jgi:hypothetical protein
MVSQDKGLGESVRDRRCTNLSMSTSGSPLVSYFPTWCCRFTRGREDSRRDHGCMGEDLANQR